VKDRGPEERIFFQAWVRSLLFAFVFGDGVIFVFALLLIWTVSLLAVPAVPTLALVDSSISPGFLAAPGVLSVVMAGLRELSSPIILPSDPGFAYLAFFCSPLFYSAGPYSRS